MFNETSFSQPFLSHVYPHILISTAQVPRHQHQTTNVILEKISYSTNLALLFIIKTPLVAQMNQN